METPKSWKKSTAVIVLCVILVDQISKIIVLNTMTLGMTIPLLGDWLKFTFTENPGMAFGMQFGPPALIAIFSVLATFLIILYLFKIGSIYRPYQTSLSFVLGGALGNIIDRVFYGAILYDEPLFLGKVVDFIHVNVWRGYVPDGIPFIGGSYMALFPIWNVADMSIVLGVVGIIFFQKRFHDISLGLLESEATENSTLPDEVVINDEAPLDLPSQPSSDTEDPRQ
ncbi:signal peptidase II [bacterium]|nr:signal peptidase II [bacterium]